MGTDGPLHGANMMPSTTEFLREGEDGLWSPTMGAWLPIRSCLSAILETDQSKTERYKLSARACQGILNRAQRRGKELPEELKLALLRQAEE